MNTLEKVSAWTAYLAAHPSVPFGPMLAAHMAVGRVTRLCECGCNSFDLKIPAGTILDPLCPPGRGYGMFFEIDFESDAAAQVTCLFFADDRGFLAGIDVTCGAGPMPDRVTLGKVLSVDPGLEPPAPTKR